MPRSRHERYPSNFKNLGYRWVPGTEKISEIGYRWVPGTEKISEIKYRWVPVTEKISKVVYRWVPRKFQKMELSSMRKSLLQIIAKKYGNFHLCSSVLFT